jgi:DNA-binding NarL/FixJ family response regulator
VGDLGLALSLTDELEARGRALGRRWALATAKRCRALVEAEKGRLDAALALLESAVSVHEQLPMPFELGRILLIKGAIERRARRRRAARDSLEQALTVFERLSTPLWSKRARAELGHISGRPRASDALTGTQQRVATLVAEGRTNREVAASLFVSERTIEGHLTRIYGKLGIRSRTELARHFARAPQ